MAHRLVSRTRYGRRRRSLNFRTQKGQSVNLGRSRKGSSSANPMENGRGDRLSYDEEGQLVEAWYNAADPANAGTGNTCYDLFTYDEMGNR